MDSTTTVPGGERPFVVQRPQEGDGAAVLHRSGGAVFLQLQSQTPNPAPVGDVQEE
ncbi:hypothetical protein ACFW5D_16850 [Streptomyces sp. NPDC058770]|uniref:hypothetical protein n=1 Tax=Streptomyces sp. NPDC058770 TaxID=3346631 RepID=UPI0036C1A39B